MSTKVSAKVATKLIWIRIKIIGIGYCSRVEACGMSVNSLLRDLNKIKVSELNV